MVVIVGLVIAAGVLYFWLLGHWFARVLAFLIVFAPILGLLGFLLGGGTPGGVTFVILGVVAAWFASGIPFYIVRAKQNQRLRVLDGFLNPDLTKYPRPPVPNYHLSLASPGTGGKADCSGLD